MRAANFERALRRSVSLERVIADVVLVTAGLLTGSVAHALWLRGLAASWLDGVLWYGIPPQGPNSGVVTPWETIVIALPLPAISTFVFACSGFYTKGLVYESRLKPVVVLGACSTAYLLYAGVAYLILPGSYIPRLVWVTAWATTCTLLVASRLWSKRWRRVIGRENLQIEIRSKTKRVTVVGGGGYIGSVLVRLLLQRNNEVVVLDPLLYGDAPVADLLQDPRFALIRGDARRVEHVVAALRSSDAVVHLGAIVGDSACALDEQLAIEINVAATRMMAEVAKGFGVRRFVFASTCSVYGASDKYLTETSGLNPVSLYARTKVACEEVLRQLSDECFSPIILRLATIYGLSPRPRFDLALNLLTAKAVVEKRFTVFGGDQWRPFVHVYDVARAINAALEISFTAGDVAIINVGSDAQNVQMRDLGRLIELAVPGAQMTVDAQSADRRNYRVRFDRARKLLKFEPTQTIEDGIQEIVRALQRGEIGDYRAPRYNNFQYLSDPQKLATMRLADSIFDLQGFRQLANAEGPSRAEIRRQLNKEDVVPSKMT